MKIELDPAKQAEIAKRIEDWLAMETNELPMCFGEGGHYARRSVLKAWVIRLLAGSVTARFLREKGWTSADYEAVSLRKHGHPEFTFEFVMPSLDAMDELVSTDHNRNVRYIGVRPWASAFRHQQARTLLLIFGGANLHQSASIPLDASAGEQAVQIRQQYAVRNTREMREKVEVAKAHPDLCGFTAVTEGLVIYVSVTYTKPHSMQSSYACDLVVQGSGMKLYSAADFETEEAAFAAMKDRIGLSDDKRSCEGREEVNPSTRLLFTVSKTITTTFLGRKAYHTVVVQEHELYQRAWNDATDRAEQAAKGRAVSA